MTSTGKWLYLQLWSHTTDMVLLWIGEFASSLSICWNFSSRHHQIAYLNAMFCQIYSQAFNNININFVLYFCQIPLREQITYMLCIYSHMTRFNFYTSHDVWHRVCARLSLNKVLVSHKYYFAYVLHIWMKEIKRKCVYAFGCVWKGVCVDMCACVWCACPTQLTHIRSWNSRIHLQFS